MVRSGVIALLLGSQGAPALAADCSFAAFSTVPGVDMTTRWTVRSGRPCDMTVPVNDGIGVSSMLVVDQAGDGTASTPTESRIRYVSRPGFVGHDRFVISRTAESMARRVLRGTAHWTVEVDVVP